MDDNIMRMLGLLSGPGPNTAMGGGGGIEQHSGLLGMQAPQPITANPVAPPPPHADTRSIIDKIRDGIGQVPAALMPAPQGMDSLLSPDDVGAARGRGVLDFGLSLLGNAQGQNGGNAPGLGASLAAGVQAGRAGYQGALDSTVQGRMTGMQLGQQAHILQGRQAIGQFMQKNMTGDQTNDFAVLRKAYMLSAAMGDHETMKALSPLLEKDPSFQKQELSHVDMGDKIGILDPRTGQVVRTYPKGKLPMSDEARASMEASLGLRRESLDARQEQQASTREARMVSQYDQNTKRQQAQAIALQSLNEMRSGAFKGDPVSQQTALQDFIRLVLPGQIVSQGELHKYANQLGLGQKGALMLQRLDNGQPLDMSVIKSIYNHADALAKSARGAGDYYRKQFQKRGAKYKIDPEAFVDHFGFLDQTQGGAPATGASAIDRHLNRSY
jgi:hypothetical protein